MEGRDFNVTRIVAEDGEWRDVARPTITKVSDEGELTFDELVAPAPSRGRDYPIPADGLGGC